MIPSQTCAAAAAFTMAAITANAAPVALDPNAFASSGTLNLTTGAYTIDTKGRGGAPVLRLGSTVIATGSVYAQGGRIDPKVAVFDFDSLSISYGASITVTGKYPLALLSRSNLTLDGPIDCSGQNGSNTLGGAGGPGGFAGGAGAPGGGAALAGRGPGGGQPTFGGTAGFGAGGAYGGPSAGDLFNNPSYGGRTYGNLRKALTGGSGGSGSGSAFGLVGGGGGGGGGAVELVALGEVTIFASDQAANGAVLANGGYGAGDDGGSVGGGGSGGGIVIAAPTINLVGSGAVVQAGAGDWDGGGGRVLLLANAGGIACNGSQPCSSSGLGLVVSTSVSAHYYSAGVVQVGTLDGFREPGPKAVAQAGPASVALLH